MSPDVPASGTPAPQSGLTRHGAFAIALLVAGGFFLRAWGYDWGLRHPDEAKTVSAALAAADGQLRPDYARYSYGALNIYWNAAAVLARRIVATIAPLPRLGGQVGAHRLLRLLSAAASALTLLVVWRLGLRLLGGDAAVWAVLIHAAAFLPVQCGHYVTPDSLLTLLVAASTLLALRLLDSGRALDAALSGVLAGLAAATKYTGILVLAAPLLAAVVAAPARGRRLGIAIASVVAAAAGYAAGDPYSIIDFRAFIEHSFLMQVEVYGGEVEKSLWARGPDTSLVWNARYLAQVSPGIVPLLLAAAGAVVLFRKSASAALVLSVPPLLFLAVYSSFPLRFDRNLLVLHPALALLAGCAVARGLDVARRRVGNGAALALAAAAVIVLAVLPARKAALFDSEIRRKTTHDLVEEQLAELERQGSGAPLLYYRPDAFARSYRDWAAQGIRVLVLVSRTRDPLLRAAEQYPEWSANVREIERECTLLATFSNPLFDSGTFAPKELEPSAQTAPTHNPTFWIYRIPDGVGGEPVNGTSAPPGLPPQRRPSQPTSARGPAR